MQWQAKLCGVRTIRELTTIAAIIFSYMKESENHDLRFNAEI